MVPLKSVCVLSSLLFSFAPVALAQENNTVTIALQSSLPSVDSCQVQTGSTGRVIKLNVVEALTEIDFEKGGVKPRLATGWERITPQTWRFKLREGAKFHDGLPLDAQAVVFSIERALDPKLSCDAYQRYFGNTKVSTKIVDPSTIEITTDPVQPILPTLMEAVSIISPSTPKGELTRSPIGTGPYKFTKWDTQREIILDRNDAYWGQKPEVVQAKYVWREDSFVRASMVKLGEADLALGIADQHADDPFMDFTFNDADTTRIHVHIDQPPLNDIRIRKALNLALDREGLVGVLFNKGVRPASQIVGPATLGYNGALKPFPFDLSEAKRFVDAAKADGVPVDRTIVMHASTGGFPNEDEALEAFVSMWEQAGLHIKVEKQELAQFRKALRPPFDPKRSPTISLTSHDNLTGDAGFSIMSKYHSSSWQADVPGPQTDALIEAAMASTDETRRRKFEDIFAKIHSDVVPEVWLYEMVSTIRVNPRIKYTPNAASNVQVELATIKFN
ncbi:ABC transporter substrate-binding protein [Ensifer sp. YR511]|uniref:ABC transporter substrate-binding protein n=1 Tax=Ensifer sp. YR511 TaxID=1855294 RepID=UPI00088E43B5|nr:ABC transporter substrate-binding protein [Ensifer sp. YR511]SDN42277.1 peptide/nickel transport system substrate-binding protein [Ensifer sp. YR511]